MSSNSVTGVRMANTQKYLNHLLQNTGITPACSEEEHDAANIIAQIFEDHGFEPEVQEFTASGTPKVVQAVLGIVVFVSTLFMGLGGVVGIIFWILNVAAAVVYMLERMGKPIFSQLGAGGLSQNVVAYHKASGPLASPRNRPVVVVAHYDSPREDFMCQEPFSRYRSLLVKMMPSCMVIPAVLGLVMLFPIPSGIDTLLWVVAIIVALVPLFNSIAIIANRFVLPYTTGSVCNKSSVAAMLGVMDDVAPIEGEEFPEDVPFDQYFSEQKRMRAEELAAIEAEQAAKQAAKEARRNKGKGEGDQDVVIPTAQPAAEGEYGEEYEGSAFTEDFTEEYVPVEETAEFDADETIQYAANEDEYLAGETVSFDLDELEEAGIDDSFEDEEEVEGAHAADETFAMDAGEFTAAADETGETGETGEMDLDLDELEEPESLKYPLVNEEGNIRFGPQIVRSLGMLPESCVLVYPEDIAPEEDEDDYEDAESSSGRVYQEPIRTVGPNSYASYSSYSSYASYGSYDDFEPDEPEVAEEPEAAEEHAEETAPTPAYKPTHARATRTTPTTTRTMRASAHAAPAAEPEPEPEDEPVAMEEPVAVEDPYAYAITDEVPEEEPVEEEPRTNRVVAWFSRKRAEFEASREQKREEAAERERQAAEEAAAAAAAEEAAKAQAEADEAVASLDDVPGEEALAEGAPTYPAADETAEVPVRDLSGIDISDTAIDAILSTSFDELGEVPSGEQASAAVEDSEEYYEAEVKAKPEEDAEEAPAEEAEPVVAEAPAEEEEAPEPAIETAEDEMPAEAAGAAEEPVRDNEPVEDAVEGEPVAGGRHSVSSAPVAEEAPEPEPAPAAEPEPETKPVQEQIDLGATAAAKEDDQSSGINDAVDSIMAQINASNPGPSTVTRTTSRATPRRNLTVPSTADVATTRTPNAANRASLFDLPDPADEPVDPFASPFSQQEQGGEQPQAAVEEAAKTDEPQPISNNAVGTAPATSGAEKEKHGFGHSFGRKKAEDEGMTDWLGDDESGNGGGSGSGSYKGGATSSKGASEEELRESITSMGDDELLGHDIWFVAAGASEEGNAGINAFLDEHRDSLRGVFLINLECVGAGQVSMVATEGDRRVLKGDKRIMNLVAQVSEDFHSGCGVVDMPGVSTDAYAAMNRSLRALTVGGIEGSGFALSHSPEDQPYNVDPDNVAFVSDVVTEVIRRS